MTKLNILVTGSSGFIGGAIIKFLARNEWNVFALDCQQLPDDILPHIKLFYHQDITKPFVLDKSFDLVIHLASLNITHVGEASFDDYYEANVLGTKNLIRAVDTKTFIFMSSSKVYKQQGIKIFENSIVDPVDDYAKSKLQAEEICRKCFSGENLLILRSVNIVGAGQFKKAIIPVFFDNAKRNLPLNIFVPQGLRIQLIHIHDLARLFETIMQHDDIKGTYNVSSEESITVKSLAQQIVETCRSDSEIICSNQGEVGYSQIMSDKLIKQLNWKIEMPIQRIIKDCHNHLCASENSN